ncbi:hypothetical protein Bca52824_028692 [Brassica carinata]|uniref:Hydroxyproline-rich glycoprotein family protein n=1 Tax=Brassica carinata TaxID=52824 RepID=A0A8X7VD85_BRACI|nr:hypothetical protein Bca52824_028692 [Brassica carinata]
MKTSLRRLRGALHKHESKDRRDLRFLVQKDELAQASQDVQDMRDCYDSLLSAAAATANSAYEFSESLRELGACLLEKTALNDDEESGRVLLMLGKLQFELQKLVDKYRSHIFQTITVPSESLLNELRIVEEMMRLCDEKRNVYEGMLTRQREKGRSKSGKEETFSAQQLQQAHEEYDNETTLFVFRLKSLKQGQTRSLLTQAARHHAAQLCFFKKALNSLEEVEPHVQTVTKSQHIDYHFSGLDDDDGDDGVENNDEDDSEVNDDGELSFEYRGNDKDQNADSSPSVSSQLGQSDITFPVVAGPNTAQKNEEANYGKCRSFRRDVRIESQSAPLFAENRTTPPSEKLLRMRSSLTRKFSTYALPTPVETARSPSSITSLVNTNNMTSSNPAKAKTKNIWYSSPLETRGPAKVSSRPMTALKEQVLRESNKNTSSQLPRPLSDGLLYSRIGSLKRRSFSGPITSKPLPNKPLSSTPRLYSGPIPRNPVSKLPKVSSSSPTASPTFVSTPKISELHELPRPPTPCSSAKSSRAFGYSAPLVSKSQLLSKPLVSSSAAPLPIPPAITRSFSIPTSNLRATELDMSKTSLGTDKLSTASPPLTPMSLIQPPPSSIPEHAEHLPISKQERKT